MRKFKFFVVIGIIGLSVLTDTAQNAGNQDYRERFVRESVRNLFPAQMTFSATIGNGTFGSMSELLEAGMIDRVLAGGSKYGYDFVLSRTPANATTPARFVLTATPRNYPRSGRRSYYIDESGEMRGGDRNGDAADRNDPVISGCDSYGMAINERCAVADLRLIMGAELTYSSTVGAGQYGSLQQLRDAGLLPGRLATGTTNGYSFTAEQTTAGSIRLRATPVSYGTTGNRSFYLDENSILRGADRQGEPAGPDDPPIDF